MYRDHIVDERILPRLACIATHWHKLLNDQQRVDFCLIRALQNLCRIDFPEKGKLRIILENLSGEDFPAYVEYTGGPALHFDRGVWADLKDGIPYAREIASHEIFHVILHDRHALSFSGSKVRFLQVHGEARSAEWQACSASPVFLIPEATIWSFQSEFDMASRCAVDSSVVQERLRIFQLLNKSGYLEWRARCLA